MVFTVWHVFIAMKCVCYVQKGVVIVDTPGIEGGNNVDHRLGKYLTKAFGFIYVINTNAAGGVQKRVCLHIK